MNLLNTKIAGLEEQDWLDAEIVHLPGHVAEVRCDNNGVLWEKVEEYAGFVVVKLVKQ